jgi:serine/threonine-protein kinase
MPLQPGLRLGPYEVLAPLGMGGMGEVYRARDSRLSRDVAIKGLPEAFVNHPDRLARFRREAQALASLSHPNVAAIFGLEEADGAPYLVLELVDGETLAARLQRGALPLRETLGLGAQIAAGVEAAHERGIVHRDLKPGNIMITPSGVVKVLDFGLARTEAPARVGVDPSQSPTVSPSGAPTHSGVILGTAPYMSPEQTRGEPVDRRSDVWSFACIVFECLTGRSPFAGKTSADLIARILEREPEWSLVPAATPPRVRDLLRRCLRKDASARPRDIRDVRIELIEAIGSGGVEVVTSEKSIAVLPFENLSGSDDEYFADGVTDEILNALAQVEGLRVAARASCFAFKGKREDLRVVGEKLDVSTVLEGSVRRSGSRLRITVHLANAADGYQLWTERYDREMTDVFEVQEAIAKAIASRLRGTLRDEGGGRRRGTSNLDAYEVFLRGRALQGKRGRFLPEAVACFERAIALDPDYAEPMAWLSDSYRLMGTFGAAPFSHIMPKARETAERALALDPNLAEAWATLACIEEQYERRFEGAVPIWERALTLDPRHSRARGQRALGAYTTGTFTREQAVAEMHRAVQDDPLSSWVGAMTSYVFGFAGMHPESIAEAERAFALDADSFFAHWNLMRGHAWAGDYDRALEMAPGLLAASGRHQWVLGALSWTYAKAGRPDAAQAIHDEMTARARLEFMSPFWLAVAADASCDRDAAIGFAERAVVERDPLVIWGRVIPFWDGIRTHARFEDVVKGVWR